MYVPYKDTIITLAHQTKVQSERFSLSVFACYRLSMEIHTLLLDVCPSMPVKKLELSGLYLENQLEDSQMRQTMEVFDDDHTVFSTSGYGTGAIGLPTITADTGTKVKGTASILFTNNAGAYAGINIRRTMASVIDCTNRDFLCLYYYGVNNGKSMVVRLECPNFSNRYEKTLTDNFTGAKRIVIPIRTMTATGTPDITQVEDFMFAESIN